MDAPSKLILSQLFEDITGWKRKHDLIHKEAKIPWSESHLSTICDYILNLDSELKLLKELPFGPAISHQTGIIFVGAPQECFLVPRLHQLYDDDASETVTIFVEALQEFFIVPKLHQLYDDDEATGIKRTEHLAVFINFLLHLLHHKTELTDSFEDKIEVLQKELRFLLTFLGDTSLQGVDLQEVNNLLAEFEDVANEAGSLIFSFIFTMDRAVIATVMDRTFGAFLEHINHLKGTITTFLILLPNIKKANTTPKNAYAGSLFIVDSLFHDLEELMNRENDQITDVKGQIGIFHQGLSVCKSLLKDIRVLQHSEIQELKGIVMQIRDVAYEAEYLINSFLVEDNSHWYFTLRFADVTQKIEFIGTQLKQFKKSFDIGVFKVAMDYSAQLLLQAKTNSEVDDIEVGIEEKAIYILDQLVGGTKNLQIISIFGMPGLGKTTLARKCYNHPSVKYYFDKCSWCVVSQTYQKEKLLIDILISLGSELERAEIVDMKEGSLAECIYKSLKGRRYIIVMDDVWDCTVWYDLRRYFPNDKNGSRILFTSRNKDVASRDGIIYELPSLSNDQCWELLCKKVFHNNPCPPQLLQIGRNIAANCKGLPLAAVVTAGILSTMDKEESTWEKVYRSLRSHIFSVENNSMAQILELSYKHLPDHLKPCFLYFGAFPEDTETPVKKLKHFWIAEGFISKQGNKSAENVGEEYLMELIDRSLVIVTKRRSSDGGPKACVVHDLLLDWCLKIAEEENFLKLINNNYSISTKHRRLHIYNTRTGTLALRELSLPFGLHVRSLFLSYQGSSLLNIFDTKLLRVLDSFRSELSISHGDGIEHLVRLRYLSIDSMPASIDKLMNLEFLTVHPRYLHSGHYSIPSAIQKMVKLRYLKAPHAKFGEDWNTSKISNLEFLSNVQIYDLEDEKKLKCLPHLRRIKCHFPPFWEDKDVYLDLSFLTQLESLSIAAPLTVNSSAVINFPTNIKKLTLDGLGLPGEKMSIIGGLPNLQVLKIGYHAFVGNVWETRDGEFQQLKFLKIYGSNLAKWSVASWEHFPKLQQLMLHTCSELEEIPSEMGEIATLQLIEVESCPRSVEESAIQIQEEQRDLGNEELRVIIDGVKTMIL